MNMDQQRGRSPSAGHHAHLTNSTSVSPHPHAPLDNLYQQQQQQLQQQQQQQQQSFANTNPSFSGFTPQFDPGFSQQDAQQYLDPQATLLDFGQNFQAPGQQVDVAQHTFLQSQANLPTQTTSSSAPYMLQHTQSYNSDHLSPGSSSVNLNGAPSPYSTSSETTSFPNFDLDTSGQGLIDSSLGFGQQQSQQQQRQQQQKQQHQQQQQQTFDHRSSLASLDPMAAATHHSPTPPHLLHANNGLRNSSQSPSPHASPSFQHMSFNDQSARPRSESLDPASAAYPPHGYHGNGWTYGKSFQNHRRAPSDTYSEISTHSAQASPYLGPMDSFDDASPMLNAQDPSLYNDVLGFQGFSLSDSQLAQSHVSPGHSPLVSPNLMPQLQSHQSIPDYIPLNNFNFSPDMSNQNAPTFDSFQPAMPEPFPQLNAATSPGDFGQADVMSPPEINIDFAPPSRQPSFGPPNANGLEDTLSPPDRSPSRNRMRAKSDSFASAGSRPSTPGFGGRGRSPSLQPTSGAKDSLSPHAIRLPSSRSPSPSSRSSVSGGGNRSRASSVSSAPQRDYILDLANPDRGTGAGNDPKRQQKHPATFQCTLCPKKFTRAYNLRSHLRTHTDERPFVCTVCGKAFARQHDRKRHEGLHSGEKKFVCKGTLKTGEQWGCGRRFARADALGRHFRSEAGRVCIRPLLDEEATERQRLWQEEQNQMQMQNAQGFVAPAPMAMQPHLPIFPAALLQTYPELASFNFGDANAASIPEDPMDAYSGRSSFDASSGGEWDGLSENEMGGSFQGNQHHRDQQANGGAVQSMGMNNGWNPNHDYMSDFEGR